MKKTLLAACVVIALFAFVFSSPSHAGPPFNNLEGVGGIAFNPLAYTAGTNIEKDKKETEFSYKDVLSKPQIGGWYTNLPNSTRTGMDMPSFGIGETLFKRLELSYGYEAASFAQIDNVHMNNFGAKLLLLKENDFNQKWLPAVSAGIINKNTTGASISSAALGLTGVKTSSQDYYLVATKLITQTPLPVLISAGALSTQGIVTGLLGFDSGRRTVFFGNFDVLPIKQIAVGFEYKQGARFADVRNSDYYDFHVAYFVDKHFTVIAAYVNTGPSYLPASPSANRLGLGDGFTLSGQYQF